MEYRIVIESKLVVVDESTAVLVLNGDTGFDLYHACHLSETEFIHPITQEIMDLNTILRRYPRLIIDLRRGKMITGHMLALLVQMQHKRVIAGLQPFVMLISPQVERVLTITDLTKIFPIDWSYPVDPYDWEGTIWQDRAPWQTRRFLADFVEVRLPQI